MGNAKLIELRNLEKKYPLPNGEAFYALKNISVSFPYQGLIGIYGKSGCGKTTLLHLMTLLDSPTGGELFYQGRKMNEIKEEEKEKFLLHEVSFIFQDYQLLENETVERNIFLPDDIVKGKKKKKKKQTEEMLSLVHLSKNQLHQKVRELSGGECQRVCLLRAMIKESSFLACDEPTGALDYQNSRKVMEILKKISREKLVIVVSHDEPLLKEYADEIMTFCDGKLQKKEIHPVASGLLETAKKKQKPAKESWTVYYVFKNILSHFKKNLFTLLSMTFSLTLMFLVLGLSFGYEFSVKAQSHIAFNYGSVTLSKQTKKSSGSSLLSYTKSSKPEKEELTALEKKYAQYYFVDNLDIFFPSSLSCNYGDYNLTSFTFEPVYSFRDSSVSSAHFLSGSLPEKDDFLAVVINLKAYESLKVISDADPLNQSLKISYQKEIDYVSDSQRIEDLYLLEESFRITGVYDEFSYLSTPTVYYSYSALCDYLTTFGPTHLKQELGDDFSWLDRSELFTAQESYSSYSERLFLKNIEEAENIESDIEAMESPYVLSSKQVSKTVSLISLFKAANIGMYFALGIIILSALFIMIILFSSTYYKEKKPIALFLSLGAKRSHIFHLFLKENLFFSSLSYLFSLVLAYLLSLGINFFISTRFGFNSIITLSWGTMFSLPYFIPLFSFLSLSMVTLIVTGLPFLFSKKVSIKEEMKSL